MLERLARACFRRRGRTVVVWLVGLVALCALGWGAIGPDFDTDFTLPASETRDVFEFLEQRSPQDAGFTGQIAFSAPQGISDPAVKAAMESIFAQVVTLDGVRVRSPYDAANDFQVSKGKPIAYARLDLTDRPYTDVTKLAGQIQKIGGRVAVPNLTIEYGGEIFYEFKMPASEALGVLAAVIILLVAFGSVLAMGLPIATALAGLLTSLALVAIASNQLTMPEFTPAMAALVGLGVGIDYALFIVTRYREGLAAGEDPELATVNAVDSSGRAVLFAGTTVIISLLGLFLVGLDFVRGVATACILAVLMMMIAAVTLLPALLGFVKLRIHVTKWRGVLGFLIPVVLFIPAVGFELAPLALIGLVVAVSIVVASFFVPFLRSQIPMRAARPREQTFWFRWSRFIQRRPWRAFLAGLVPLVILAIPLFSIRLGFSDTGNYPKEETTRRAYDLLADGFGPGFNGPMLVLVQAKPGATVDVVAVDGLVQQLNQTEGVAFASSPTPLGPDASLITLIPAGAPQDSSTSELIHRLRDDVIPASGINAKVGGFSAVNVDFSDYLGRRLPWIIGSVLVLSFLLLMLVFRSLLVPLKAVIMNLLSIGAAYGVIVAIFQWGWGKGLVGLDRAGPIESWVPMFLFAVVFGLSMDYEVFLLSRMKEEFDRTRDNGTAVADGLALTARVITAAALIMVCVFASFVLGPDRQLKLFGLGMAIAVLVDATIVRMVLVPATMELLGARNWWIPAWLGRVLPKVHIEGKHHVVAVGAAGSADGPPLLVPAESATTEERALV